MCYEEGIAETAGQGKSVIHRTEVLLIIILPDWVFDWFLVYRLVCLVRQQHLLPLACLELKTQALDRRKLAQGCLDSQGLDRRNSRFVYSFVLEWTVRQPLVSTVLLAAL